MRRILEGVFQEASGRTGVTVRNDGWAAQAAACRQPLYLVILGTFLGAASTALVREVAVLKKLADLPVWFWWMLPLTCITCDRAEDALIFAILNGTSTVEASVFSALEIFRAIKITSITVAIGQLLLLSGFSFSRSMHRLRE